MDSLKSSNDCEQGEPNPPSIFLDSELDPKAIEQKELLDATMAEYLEKEKKRRSKPRVFDA